jgi:hypothetical protein
MMGKPKLGRATFFTDAFRDLGYDDAEIVGHRILSLSHVNSIDWIDGIIEVECDDDPVSLFDIATRLEVHLNAPIAPGERVEEVFHECGKTVYTYKYHPGEYPMEAKG